MSTIGTIEVAQESGVAIYDAKTGDIVHFHEVTTLRGGTHPDDKAVETEAMALFAKQRSDFKRATAVLRYDPSQRNQAALYKVDVKKRVLIEQTIKAKRATR